MRKLFRRPQRVLECGERVAREGGHVGGAVVTRGLDHPRVLPARPRQRRQLPRRAARGEGDGADARVGEVARLMTDAGLIVLTAFISPFRAERELVEAVDLHRDVDAPAGEAKAAPGYAPPPPAVPGFMVTYSRMRLRAPITSRVSSPAYFRSCGASPMQAKG